MQVLHDEPGFAIAVQRNVALAVWRAAPRPEWFAVIRAKTWPYADAGPGAASGWVNLILSGTPSFSEEIRREAAALSDRDDIYQLGTAHIVTFEGLKGTAVRAFLSTVFLLARVKTPTKVFATIDTGAAWLAPLLGEGWSADELAEFCRACESTLGLVPG